MDIYIRGAVVDFADEARGVFIVGEDGGGERRHGILNREGLRERGGLVRAADAAVVFAARKRDGNRFAVSVKREGVGIVFEYAENAAAAAVVRALHTRSGRDGVGVQQREGLRADGVGHVFAEDAAGTGLSGNRAGNGVIGNARSVFDGDSVGGADDAAGIAVGRGHAVDAGVVRGVVFERRAVFHFADESARVARGGGYGYVPAGTRGRNGKLRALSERSADQSDVSGSGDREAGGVVKRHGDVAVRRDIADEALERGRGDAVAFERHERDAPVRGVGPRDDVVREERAASQYAVGRHIVRLLALYLHCSRTGDAHIGRNVVEERTVEQMENVDAAGGNNQRSFKRTALRTETYKAVAGNYTAFVDG